MNPKLNQHFIKKSVGKKQVGHIAENLSTYLSRQKRLILVFSILCLYYGDNLVSEKKTAVAYLVIMYGTVFFYGNKVPIIKVARIDEMVLRLSAKIAKCIVKVVLNWN